MFLSISLFTKTNGCLLVVDKQILSCLEYIVCCTCASENIIELFLVKQVYAVKTIDIIMLLSEKIYCAIIFFLQYACCVVLATHGLAIPSIKEDLDHHICNRKRVEILVNVSLFLVSLDFLPNLFPYSQRGFLLSIVRLII